jgi:hypothetical protein
MIHLNHKSDEDFRNQWDQVLVISKELSTRDGVSEGLRIACWPTSQAVLFRAADKGA